MIALKQVRFAAPALIPVIISGAEQFGNMEEPSRLQEPGEIPQSLAANYSGVYAAAFDDGDTEDEEPEEDVDDLDAEEEEDDEDEYEEDEDEDEDEDDGVVIEDDDEEEEDEDDEDLEEDEDEDDEEDDSPVIRRIMTQETYFSPGWNLL